MRERGEVAAKASPPSLRLFGRALLTLTILITGLRTEAATLPIYIEDNHAGTFYWLAEHLDLDQPCTLLHFDAHSDASAIFDSDKIRTAIRQVSSREERRRLLEKWRNGGTVQCFNWIEPLMPAPISRVIWIRQGGADEMTARRQIDGHAEAAPRATGSFASRYEATDLAHLESKLSKEEAIIASIDLDSFSGLSQDTRAEAFGQVWKMVAKQPNLRAVTFAISRAYLKDDAEADALLLLAMTAARSLPLAQIEFEPFARVPHDHSLRGREFAGRGEQIPAFNVASASAALRSVLIAESSRLVVRDEPERWQALLGEWQKAAPQVSLELKECDRSTDGIWRIPAGQSGQIQLVVQPWTAAPDRVEWFALLPEHPSCNVSRLKPDQVGFIADAAARPAWTEQRLEGIERQLSLGQLDALFDSALHCGSVRLRARSVFRNEVRETPVIEIRRYAGSGFRAAITEQFGLPYLFGGGELSVEGETGAEANLGTDCANFVIYAMRRQGLAVPWSDPKQLRNRLNLIARGVEPGGARLDSEALQSGLIVHLGAHVAAVLEDRPPLGVLDEGDLVAHQLKGLPEVVTLSQLLGARQRRTFDLFQLRVPARAGALSFGGDVMLGRTLAGKIRCGANPFAQLKELLAQSSFLAANLECVLTNPRDVTAKRAPLKQPGATRASSSRPYRFAAPPESAEMLQRCGFRALALANNHALDFGEAELKKTAAKLREHGIEPTGLASTEPTVLTLPNGRRLGLVALTDLPGANDGLLSTSDKESLASALTKARTAADLLVCMVHWGEENNPHPTERQRQLARWLIGNGAAAVVGSHPHCLQSLDFYHGKPVAYSLGNLVFDGAPSVRKWNEGALLQLYLTNNGRIGSSQLLPVKLVDGLPVASGRDALIPPGVPRSPRDLGRDELVSSAP